MWRDYIKQPGVQCVYTARYDGALCIEGELQAMGKSRYSQNVSPRASYKQPGVHCVAS